MRNQGRSFLLYMLRRGMPLSILTLFMAAGGPNSWGQTLWKPERNVDFIVATTPGSALDIIARRTQAIWREKRIVEVPVTVDNKPGGSMSLAVAYLLNQPAGDGHFLAVFAPTLLTSYIIKNHRVNYADGTPIAYLGEEYFVWVVRGDAPIRSGKDLMDQLRKNPNSLAIGTSNIGGLGHIQLLSIFKAAGVDIRKMRIVGFKGGSEAQTALLGGHIDLITTNGSNVVTLKESGRVRVLAINAPKRLGGIYADVPTWKEEGVDTHILSAWSAVIGAKGLSSAQTTYWDDAFSKIVKTDEWIADAKQHLRSTDYKNSRQTDVFLKTENDKLKQFLSEFGLIKE